MNIKLIIQKELNKIEDNDVALLLSGGIDSLFLLFCLLELKKNVTCYTFCLEDRESSDLIYAVQACKIFGLKHRTIWLPTNIKSLIKDIQYLIPTYSLKKKTEVECMWPLWKVIQKSKHVNMVTGLAAGIHFGQTKKARIHYSQTAELMNEFREDYFLNPKNREPEILDMMCLEHKKKMYHPFFAKELLQEFKGTTWNDINKPLQKQPLLDCFPNEFKKVKIRIPQNFQCGDSGIIDLFHSLLNDSINTKNWKSTIGIYNEIRNGKISDVPRLSLGLI